MSENLNCNELRIGNYLEMLGKVKKVECISNLPARKEMYWLTCKDMIDTKIIHFNPILLTEDWLLKLGFVKNDFDSHYEKGEFYIEVWEKDFVFRWNDFNIDINLNSVHRIQNLYFTLTGEELTLIKRDENTTP
jgi:hypothetical protein